MKTILITGTKGFIGNNLLKELKNQGNEIIIEVNEDIFDFENWEYELINILVSNRPDVIYHVGACSNTLEQDVNYMMKLNFEFTKILVDWSEKYKCKLIYSSSAANYGQNEKHPSNLYGWSKYVAEQYVISKNGIALRYFNVYGPGEEKKGPMASVAYQSFITKKNENKIWQLFPQKPKRDFVYVKDVVSANLFAEKNYVKLNKNWYEVGAGEARTFEEVLECMGILYSYHDESKIPLGYQFYTCSKRERWMSGWTPKYNIKTGLKEYNDYLLSINK
jgi:ADP-L-glycero-D-manno-heptose 6-epimerase